MTKACQKCKYPLCISLIQYQSFSSSELFPPACGPSQDNPCASVSSELQSSFQRSTGPLGSMWLCLWVCLCVRAETADGRSLWRYCSWNSLWGPLHYRRGLTQPITKIRASTKLNLAFTVRMRFPSPNCHESTSNTPKMVRLGKPLEYLYPF